MENEDTKRKCVIEKLEWCTHDEEVTESSMAGKNGRIDLKRKNKGVPIFSVDVQPTQNDGVERFATGTFFHCFILSSNKSLTHIIKQVVQIIAFVFGQSHRCSKH